MTSSYENGSPLSFTFDHAFPPSAAQVDVYNVSAKPIVESVMQGFNGTVLAYGQTSSGKTFTMTGPDMNDGEMMGVIPRMVSTVFDQIESSDPKIEFQVKVGYCEIYLERIKDLLDTSKVNLKVHEDRARGIYIAELTEDYVSSRDEVYHLMRLGSSNREVGYTQMNSGSSRSHSIFILTVTQTSLTDLATKTGKLFLVDLAGSEKVGKTGAEGKRLEEAKNINKSLTMLGNVITALTDGKSSHVPYRDSKLTRVLQDSLGGNSKTTLIVTCSPSPFNEAETISTLRFGVRAKSIKNKPKVNREYSVNELKLMLAQAKEEISKKDRIIAALKKGQGNANQDPLISKQNDLEDADENSSDEKSEKDSPSSEMYSQVMIELDYLQQKLSETESTLRKYRSLAEDFEDENLQMKEDHVFIYKQVADLQNKLIQTEESVAQLNIENESLKNELIVEIEKKFKLENELVEKNSQLIEANNDIIQTVKQEKAKITGLLEEEKLKNAELNKDIERMTQELKQNMKNMNEDNKLKLLELNYQTDRERWDKERISLQNQIKHGASQVISLQIQLEESSKIFKNLENTMSEGERHTKKVNDQLKRNLEQLNLMYHNLLSSSSQHKVNRAIAEKKATRLQDRLTLAEKALKDMSEKFLNSEKEVSSLKFNLHELEITNKCLSSGFAVSGNIRKVIRGGGDLVFKPNRRTNSAIPETSLTEENEDD
jgi:kinesin family protein 5